MSPFFRVRINILDSVPIASELSAEIVVGIAFEKVLLVWSGRWWGWDRRTNFKGVAICAGNLAVELQ